MARLKTVPGKDGSPERFLQRYEFLSAPGMKEKWVQWRCDKIFDYHKRLRDRIRGDRHDLIFGVVGDFRNDLVFDVPDSVTERARNCGIDIQRLKSEDGLAVIPYARYGFRTERTSRSNRRMKSIRNGEDRRFSCPTRGFSLSISKCRPMASTA